MIINNPTRKYIYFNRKSNEIQVDIYDLLSINILRRVDINAHDRNILGYNIRPDQYNEVIEGIVPIPPRSRWVYDGTKFTCINNSAVPLNFSPDISELIEISEKLCSVIFKKKVAIELSGGLDTSIIIGLVNHFGYDPFLIGMKSSRYEYRTESYIQDKFAKSFSDTCLLDSSDSLPFSNLLSTPAHQLPSASSLYYMHALRISKECSKKHIDIILSGNGFDTLLCENPNSLVNYTLPITWHTWMLDDNWYNENIYNKLNIGYYSGAASQILIKSIWKIRSTHSEDVKKKWARRAFSEYLNSELVNYSYKADYSGYFFDGFMNSKNEISDLFKIAYEITKFKEFKQSALDDLYIDAHLPNEKKDKSRLARVSLANWIFGLVRDKKIK